MYGIYGLYWLLPVLSTGRTTTTGEGQGASPRQQTCPLRQRCVALVPGDQRAPPDGSLGSEVAALPWRLWQGFLVDFFLGGGRTHFGGGWSTWKMGPDPKFHLVYLGVLVYSLYVYLGDLLTMDIYHLRVLGWSSKYTPLHGNLITSLKLTNIAPENRPSRQKAEPILGT